MVIVLNVQAGESVSIVLEFSSALPKRRVATEISELSRQESSDRRKTKLCRLKELIVEIYAAAFDDASQMQIMLRY